MDIEGSTGEQSHDLSLQAHCFARKSGPGTPVKLERGSSGIDTALTDPLGAVRGKLSSPELPGAVPTTRPVHARYTHLTCQSNAADLIHPVHTNNPLSASSAWLQSWAAKHIAVWWLHQTTPSWRLVPLASRFTTFTRTVCGSLWMVGSIESRELLGESALATLHLYLFNAGNVSHLIRHQQAGRSSRIWLRMGQTVRILATQPLAPTLQRCHVPRV